MFQRLPLGADPDAIRLANQPKIAIANNATTNSMIMYLEMQNPDSGSYALRGVPNGCGIRILPCRVLLYCAILASLQFAESVRWACKNSSPFIFAVSLFQPARFSGDFRT